jgi:hypothetical protein
MDEKKNIKMKTMTIIKLFAFLLMNIMKISSVRDLLTIENMNHCQCFDVRKHCWYQCLLSLL